MRIVIRQPNWLWAILDTSSNDLARTNLTEQDAHAERYDETERCGGLRLTPAYGDKQTPSGWEYALQQVRQYNYDGEARAKSYDRQARRATRLFHPPFKHTDDPQTLATQRAMVRAWEVASKARYEDDTARRVCEVLESAMWQYDVA